MEQENVFPGYVSDSYQRIIRAFLDGNTSIPPFIDGSTIEVPEALRDFKYEVSSLPVLITQSQRSDIEYFTKTMPEAMFQSITLWFAGQESEFEIVYKRPRILYHLLRSAGTLHSKNLFFRNDFVFNNQVIKALEMNVGSNVGGYQISQYNKVIENNLNRLLAEGSVNYLNTLSVFFKWLFQAIAIHLENKIAGNVLILTDAVYSDSWKSLVAKTFHKNKSLLFAQAECIFDSNISSITYTQSGQACHRNKILDCVLTPTTAPIDIQRISIAHLGRKLFSPDNALSVIFGQKVNFAIMHAAKAANLLNEKSATFVEQHIPLTYLLRGRGVPSNIVALLFNEKDNWVLKKSHSWQGRDVVIGRFSTEEHWKNVIESSQKGDGPWIAQQYIKPDKLPIVNADRKLSWLDAVWGSFGFCETYGGAMIRLDSPERCDGVINAARGATESIVLEYY